MLDAEHERPVAFIVMERAAPVRCWEGPVLRDVCKPPKYGFQEGPRKPRGPIRFG